MGTPLQHERRSRQRFEFQIPVSLRVEGAVSEERGLTQDLSARGAFLYTDCSMDPGSMVELTFMMPSEITLAESMRVRCRGKVLRVVHRDAVQNKVGLAVELLGYEYLTGKPENTQARTDFDRILPLHQSPEESASPPLRRN